MFKVSLLRRDRAAAGEKMIYRFFSISAAALLMLTAVSCKKVKIDPEVLGRFSGIRMIEKENQLFLHGKKASAVLIHNSCRVESSGIQMIFPDETLRSNEGVWRLPKRSAYLQVLFEPLKLQVKTIVIDPGHGGRDPGAVSVEQRIKEKDLNLDLALKLGRTLEQQGFTVLYTRDDDSTVPLAGRGGKFRADLFISIHHNASKNISASGAETYCLLSKNSFDRNIAAAFQIACEMQKAQSKASGSYGRGVKFADFKVLRDAQCPAILFEAGFITNPDDEKRAVSDNYRQIMADSLAQGIVRAVSL